MPSNTTDNKNMAKIIELLSIRPMTESNLSKKSGIHIKELRVILGELCDRKVIDHMGKMVWLTSQEDEHGRVDMSKIPEFKKMIGAAWKHMR